MTDEGANRETPTLERIFFELFEALPRQGPGNREGAIRALALCDGLPASPRVLDLGCGTGGQTMHLAELTSGDIVAIDSHAPNIARLQATLEERGLAERVQARVGDMSEPGEPAESFDLIWSEGALYNIGIGQALDVCWGLLRPGGHVVFTDAVWRAGAPDAAPDEVTAMFAEYEDMGSAADIARMIARSPLALVDHFTLPDAAWWDDFYTPMQRRIEALRAAYADDDAALASLDELAMEPEMHRRHSQYYAYEFFVARRPS